MVSNGPSPWTRAEAPSSRPSAGTLVFDEDFKLVYASKGAQATLGIAGVGLNKELRELDLSTNLDEFIMESLVHLSMGGEERSGILTLSGNPDPPLLRVTVRPMLSEGQLESLVVTIEPLGGGLNMAEAESSHAVGSLFVLNMETDTIDFMNEAARRMFGITWEGMGKPLDSISSRLPPMLVKLIREAMATRSMRFRILYMGKDEQGEARFVRWSALPRHLSKGNPTLMVMMTDATDSVDPWLRRLASQLEEEHTRLNSIVNVLPVAVLITDIEGRILMSNRNVAMLWEGDVSLRHLLQLESLNVRAADTGETLRLEDWGAGRSLREGVIIQGEVVNVDRRNGTSVSLLCSTAPIWGLNHRIVGAVSAFQDITERRALEEELARSNAELQQFAYIASHDLKEPLRMVSSYLGLLEKRYKGRVLDEEAEEFVHFAIDGSSRMRHLIDDLLLFSRVESQGKEFEPTDMNTILETALMNLGKNVEEAGAIITHDRLPTVQADPSQMVQLLQNLIDNGLKYHGEERPSVHISAHLQAGEWAISVKDNGIGIDPRHHEQLFQMFSRLHSRDQYPGTGMGLAISKKIVERHGGRIWVESDGKSGTTFFFTLPNAFESASG